MTALAMLAAIPVAMWLAQSAWLRCAGQPLRARINPPDLPERARQLNRIVTYACFVALILLFPITQGRSPLAYFLEMLPAKDAAKLALFGASAAILYLALLHLAWVVTDNVRFRVRQSAGRLIRKLAGVPLTALLAAGAEELIFRGIVLRDLLDWLPAEGAVFVGVAVFAGAHYVRSVKRYWTIGGHVALGLLLCTAFVLTGSLWLSLGLHAGGILVLATLRPLVRYTGPPWLVGASIFPYAGLVGILALLLLTGNVWLEFGLTP